MARSIFLTGILLIVFNNIFGFVDTRAEQLKSSHPAPGQLVDIGGYRLHIYCKGEGSPTVIMDSGLGNPGLVWTLVQPEIAEKSRVCVYDRAGLGWSESSPRERTAETMVDELHILLDRANIDAPYVLVGHSFGGLLMRMYAQTYPKEVVGIVLVDSYHYTQMEKNPKMHGKGNPVITMALEALNLWIASGVPALFPSLVPTLEMGKMPAESVDVYREVFAADTKAANEIQAEVVFLEKSSTEEKSAHITSLGNIPLIVLAHGYLEHQVLEFKSQEQQDEAEAFWRADQAELAALSPRGRLVIAAKSGHYIQLDQPRLVIDSIETVLADLKR